MMFALLGTSVLVGLATVVAAWPSAGAWALVAGPMTASLATLAVAALIARHPGRRDAEIMSELSDRLVADLRTIAPAGRPSGRRDAA